jgi:uncharacterized protein YgiB involved in biofilm formation
MGACLPVARVAGAQTTITVSAVSPAAGTLTAPTEAQYDANAKAAIQFSWTMSTCRSASGTNCTAQIRGAAFGSRPVSDLEWSANNSTWTPMTAGFVNIATVLRNQTGTGTVWLRLRVRWDAYLSGVTYTPSISFQVKQ